MRGTGFALAAALMLVSARGVLRRRAVPLLSCDAHCLGFLNRCGAGFLPASGGVWLRRKRSWLAPPRSAMTSARRLRRHAWFRDVMRLALLLERTYAPYQKRLGTAFSRL